MATSDNAPNTSEQQDDTTTPQSPGDQNPDRRNEAEDRARHGQSLAMGDTGDRDTGVPADSQGISNRPGDSEDGKA
jgi:hypothetical protein